MKKYKLDNNNNYDRINCKNMIEEIKTYFRNTEENHRIKLKKII